MTYVCIYLHCAAYKFQCHCFVVSLGQGATSQPIIQYIGRLIGVSAKKNPDFKKITVVFLPCFYKIYPGIF